MSSPDSTSLSSRRPSDAAAAGSSSSAIAKKKRVRNWTADDRAAHRAFERSRREAFKERLTYLARLIPALQTTDSSRLSKHVVLDESVALHLEEQRKIASSLRKIEALAAERDEMLEELNKWRVGAGLEPRQPLHNDDDDNDDAAAAAAVIVGPGMEISKDRSGNSHRNNSISSVIGGIGSASLASNVIAVDGLEQQQQRPHEANYATEPDPFQAPSIPTAAITSTNIPTTTTTNTLPADDMDLLMPTTNPAAWMAPSDISFYNVAGPMNIGLGISHMATPKSAVGAGAGVSFTGPFGLSANEFGVQPIHVDTTAGQGLDMSAYLDHPYIFHG